MILTGSGKLGDIRYSVTEVAGKKMVQLYDHFGKVAGIVEPLNIFQLEQVRQIVREEIDTALDKVSEDVTALGLPFAGLATVATFEDEQKRP